jgi:hypothetical protein
MWPVQLHRSADLPFVYGAHDPVVFPVACDFRRSIIRRASICGSKNVSAIRQLATQCLLPVTRVPNTVVGGGLHATGFAAQLSLPIASKHVRMRSTFVVSKAGNRIYDHS